MQVCMIILVTSGCGGSHILRLYKGLGQERERARRGPTFLVERGGDTEISDPVPFTAFPSLLFTSKPRPHFRIRLKTTRAVDIVHVRAFTVQHLECGCSVRTCSAR